MDFIELCCKTNHSFLAGASHPGEMIERAAELGFCAIGVTDLHGVYGIPKAYHAAKSYPGLKLITGAELLMSGGAHLTLIARDRAAYGVLCRMITAAHAGKEKGTAHLTWDELSDLSSRFAGARGLIAIPWDHKKTRYALLKELFEDRLYIPVSRFLDGWDETRLTRANDLGTRFQAPLLATNQPHYHVPERRILQDVLTAIREGTTLPKAGKNLFANAERYLKSPAQMSELFHDLPEAIEATARIAEVCTFSPSELRYRYPSEWIPKGHTSISYLASLVWQGAEKRYRGGPPPKVRRQLEHELKLIEDLSFADYFLTIWEIVEFAREKMILCQGRGSAANSAICYCLGITAVDPVRMNLLFERFISAERGEPPDIDVDFEHERREEVIQHIYEKYGRDRAGMVAAMITYRSRMGTREVSKILELPITRPEHAPEKVQKLADELYGFPRHLSIHSGGFTLSADPLIETVPIEPARMEGRTIVQWDKDDLDAIGLLKVDILALGMLSAIRKLLDLVGLALTDVPAEDPATYEMIRHADTVGVFQIESRAQMSMLPRLLPRTYYDLVIQVAIVRPGPIVGKMVHPYLKRRRGLEKPEMPHPKLVPILSKTLGVPLFQEQVMKMAMSLAGFTPGEADELRRAIGAWRSRGSIDKIGKRLMDGLLKSGLKQEFVDRIFMQIQGFAEYGFPESHSASFALLAYVSAYLKCHHPAEFCCALLNSQPMGFYSSHSLIDDAKRHGVKIHPIDPNRSLWDCEMENGGVRLGFRLVHGMSEKETAELLAERRNGPFQSLTSFLARVKLRKNTIETLAKGDVFACFGLDQRHALWEILGSETTGLFAQAAETQSGAGTQISLFPAMGEYETICSDYRSYGASVHGHPMNALRKLMHSLPQISTREAKALPGGRITSVAGLVIVRQRPPTANGTMFATLEDQDGLLDLLLRPEIFEKYHELFVEHSFLIARGKIQRDGNAVNVIVSEMSPVF